MELVWSGKKVWLHLLAATNTEKRCRKACYNVVHIHFAHTMTQRYIVTTQPNFNLTQLRLSLDIIINPNQPHHLHKLLKLAIRETRNR